MESRAQHGTVASLLPGPIGGRAADPVLLRPTAGAFRTGEAGKPSLRVGACTWACKEKYPLYIQR